MPPFEVVMIEKPTPDEMKQGATEKLVLGPVLVLARNIESAGIVAVMRDDRPTGINMDRVEVLVRPFA